MRSSLRLLCGNQWTGRRTAPRLLSFLCHLDGAMLMMPRVRVRWGGMLTFMYMLRWWCYGMGWKVTCGKALVKSARSASEQKIHLQKSWLLGNPPKHWHHLWWLKHHFWWLKHLKHHSWWLKQLKHIFLVVKTQFFGGQNTIFGWSKHNFLWSKHIFFVVKTQFFGGQTQFLGGQNTIFGWSKHHF